MRHSHRKNQVLTRAFYNNVILIGPDGRLLSTVSERKAKWYLKRNLGEEVPPPDGYPRAVKLNFEPEMRETIHPYCLTICKDQCVFCGRTEELTLHHVVPHVIRQHFPLEAKAYGRQWCVLLCVDHHESLEGDLKRLYYGPEFPHRAKGPSPTNVTLQKIKASGNLYRVPPERLNMLFSMSDYRTVDDIPPVNKASLKEHYYKISLAHHEKIREWALKFIEDHGGVEGTKKFFRDHFLTYNPQYLPEGWLEH